MKESLDFHIQEYNKKRVDKEQVFKYFYKNERSKLIELVEKHKIKEFPAIKYHDGEYIYKISEDHWITFTLQDLHKYQVLINGNSLNLKGLNHLDQMLKLTEEALSKKTSLYYLNQLIGLPEAEAGGLFGVVVIGVVGVGVVAEYISDQFDPDFQEAKAFGENYKRVKEIADLCKANKEGLLANLNEGVNSENSLIHHLLWKTQDWGYNEDKLVEAITGDFADDCTDFSEKILAGAASKNDRTLNGKDYTGERKEILSNFDCGHVPLNVGPGSRYKEQKPVVLDCLLNSCQKAIDDHEGCLKDLHGRINKSTRKENSKKALHNYGENWLQSIDSSSLGID